MNAHCYQDYISSPCGNKILISTPTGGTGLERVNIAIVESDLGDSENFNFEYLPNENDTIVWPGQLSSISQQ